MGKMGCLSDFMAFVQDAFKEELWLIVILPVASKPFTE